MEALCDNRLSYSQSTVMKKGRPSRFSDRFHELCDVAGFVSGRGRATEVSRFFNIGITSARNWLVEDICPRNHTLVKILARLQKYGRLDKSIDEKQLLLWLEKGEVYIPSPFQETLASSEPRTDLQRALKEYPGICRLLEKKPDCSTDDELANLIERALSEHLKSGQKA